MNRLSKKFIVVIVVTLALTCLCSILFNTQFLEKYYIYQKKVAMNSIRDKFADKLHSLTAEEAIGQMEQSDKVIIVHIKHVDGISNDKVNDEIRAAFQNKGIGFQKYWLWEEDYQKILGGENKIRLYKQENLNYSLLVEYIQIGSQLFAITMIIPDISDAFGIINYFLIFVNVISIMIAILFIMISIKKITKPLNEFENFASNMKNNQFVPLKVHTKDELASVADSLNSMGAQIISYQNSLQEKNRQMEQLLDDVAHELKTPISLIQLYTSGMKDGLDDGTFLDTILQENQQMAEMTDKLLYVSRIAKKDLEFNKLNLTGLLQKLVDKYTILAQENGGTLSSHIENTLPIISSEEMMHSLLTNLITNAVKYSSGPQIDIKLYQTESEIRFSIANETDNKELDLTKIWTPYYVGEQSRNKKLSGTGLGLTIVSKICERLNYSILCSLDNNLITFFLTIPLSS